MTGGVDIHTLLSTRRAERNFSIKIKRCRDTQRLFLDTKRSVRNIRVFYSYEFVRVRCHTKNASLIYLPGDHKEPVLFNQIQNRILSLEETLNTRSTVWLAVMRRFYHEKQNFDVGDILRVQKAWIGRRFVNWMKRHSSSSKDKGKRLDTYIYPRRKFRRTPVIDLQKNCKQCEPPTLRTYKSLAEAASSIDPPYIMTIPFDPFTRSVKRNFRTDDGEINQRRNTNNSTSYFEQVVIDGVERFSVFFTSFGVDEGQITAVAVPENVEFIAECNMSDSFNYSDILHDSEEVILSETDIKQVKQRLEPLLLRIDNIDELTQVDLKSTGSSGVDFRKRTISGDDDDSDGQNLTEEFSEEFEMQCFMRYKAHVKRQSSDFQPTSPEREMSTVRKIHPYYNVVVGENSAASKTITRDSNRNPLFANVSEQDFNEESDDGIEMVSFDKDGGFFIAPRRNSGITKNSSSSSKNNRDLDYLSPLNDFTRGYSHFKETASKYNNRKPNDSSQESETLPDTMVVGVDGYVRCDGAHGESTETQEFPLDGSEKCQKMKKKHLWSFGDKHKLNRKDAEVAARKLTNQTNQSLTLSSIQKRTQQQDEKSYYQPMFNIFQEKPLTPPKPATIPPLPPKRTNNPITTKAPLSKPEVKEKKRHLANNNVHRLSTMHCQESFNSTKNENEPAGKEKTTESNKCENPLKTTVLQGHSIKTSHLHRCEVESPTTFRDSNNENVPFIPPVPRKQNKYKHISALTKPLLGSSFDEIISDNSDNSSDDNERIEIIHDCSSSEAVAARVTDSKGMMDDNQKENTVDLNTTNGLEIDESDEKSTTSNNIEDDSFRRDNTKRNIFGNNRSSSTYSDVLDSRINYFESKLLISSP